MKKIKLISYFFALILIVVSFVKLAQANPLYDAMADVVFEGATNAVTTGIASGVAPIITEAPLMLITGCDSTKALEIKAQMDAGGTISFPECLRNEAGPGRVSHGGLLGLASETLGDFQTTPMPISTYAYMQNLKAESLIFKEANAAGIDPVFDGVLGIWKAIRNLAYGLLAVIILIISIMISNRSKIDAQNVVTAQAMIPRIIVSAVLITFSYAIGGLFIQMGGLWGPVSKLGFVMLTGNSSSGGDLGDFLVQLNTGTVTIGGMEINSSYREIVNRWCTMETGEDAFAMSWILRCTVMGAFNIIGAAWWLFAIGVSWLVVLVIVAFAMIFVYLTRYLKILLLTIAAPIIFVIAILPGQEDKIQNWFKDLLGAVLGVPAMFLTMALGFLIYLSIGYGTASPGLTGMAGLVSDNFATMVGNFLMIMIWIFALKVPSLVDNFIKGPPKRK